ncbi:MAG: hypothetical protein EOP60_12855 [Sphingomonadales bacterium]|nr:MAG: hypothetical protein EOP60_12855 [Sphingomonadales bacterium]
MAGKAETDVFPLPGLARIDGANLQPAFAYARSSGSWFDAFRAATALAVRAVMVTGWEPDGKTIYAVPSPRDGFRAGDLLRITFAKDRVESFFLIESENENTTSPPEHHGSVALGVTPLGSLRSLSSADILATYPNHFQLIWTLPESQPVTVDGNLRVNESSPPHSDEDRITLDVPPGFAPPPGTLLRISWSKEQHLWFQVVEFQHTTATASPPSAESGLGGRVFSWSDQAPAADPSASHFAERLTFELRVRRGETDALRLIDLGFAPAHPRFWNALPDDAQLFADKSDDAHQSLRDAAREPRFPLAGNPSFDARYIPIGMSALAEPTAAAQHSDRSALERDGLETFSSSHFLDARLLESGITTLLADADFIRYQTPEAPPLTGLHAALEIEEATLIAVPDAMHRGWSPALTPKVLPPFPSQPREHPSWWHFLECDPPASPPEAAVPDHSQFLKCNLRILHPPFLSCEGPDASGAFTLDWSSADTDAEFILEEANSPDWTGAFELWRGRDFTHTVLSRLPGNYYYRVRAEAAGESSNLSNGLVVTIAAPTRWEVKAAKNFQPDALLDIHRALLRFCAARGDIMAVLALPEHFREADALGYLGTLKTARLAASASPVQPLGTGEASAFSYAAIYHPWFIVREETAGLLTAPPDGAVTGLIARRSLARGAWIAPANEAFSGIVSLTPQISDGHYLDLLLAQLNLIRQEPRGFLVLNADTLSDDEELRPINVRRLLILLRRAALRLGMTFVFEPNDRTLRRVVQGAFESIMQQLFTRGAFAGATPAASYRVVTDDTLNTAQDFDAGRFRVDLKVAPALPMSFLTVRLVQVGERATATEII